MNPEHMDLPPIAIEWDAARTERSLHGMYRKRRRRTQRRAAAASLAVLAMVGLPLWNSEQQTGAAGVQVAELPAGDHRFGDGSTAMRVEPNTSLQVLEESGTRIAVAVHDGTGEFEVTPNPRRSFEVYAGKVQVRVLGTGFRVSRHADGEGADVSVRHGRVAVRWPGGERILTKGQAGSFPPETAPKREADTREAEPQVAVDTADEAPPETEPVAEAPGKRRARRRWQERARAGKYAEAFELLQAAEQPVKSDAQELLLAADAARLSGHPAEALPHLGRVVDEHGKDPRAALAAFTAGRLLMKLGRAEAAADRFATAYRLQPEGPMAEAASYRRVMALRRLGRAAEARRAAQAYLERFPSGRHATQAEALLTE